MAPDTYHVDPRIDLDDLVEELEITLDLDDVEYNTLGGLIYHEYGDVPQENTHIEYGGMHLKVLKMDSQRIDKVEVVVVRENGHSPSNQEPF